MSLFFFLMGQNNEEDIDPNNLSILDGFSF